MHIPGKPLSLSFLRLHFSCRKTLIIMAAQNEEPAIYVSQIIVEPTIQPEGLTSSAGLTKEEEVRARGEGSIVVRVGDVSTPQVRILSLFHSMPQNLDKIR